MFLIAKNAAVLMPRSMNGRRLAEDYLARLERLLGHQDTAPGFIPAHSEWVVALANQSLCGDSCRAAGCRPRRHRMRPGLCMGRATLVGLLIAGLLLAHGRGGRVFTVEIRPGRRRRL